MYPSKPQFYYIKTGLKGGQNYIGMLSADDSHGMSMLVFSEKSATNFGRHLKILVNILASTYAASLSFSCPFALVYSQLSISAFTESVKQE